MEKIIDIGTFIEKGINVLEESLSGLWGAIDDVISWTVEFLNDTFLAIPFIIIIAFVTFGAYYANAGKLAFKKKVFEKVQA
ncbi:hypothetical protein [Draconibacterium halophilum]|uniref:hypothetical protein n=1 Tax=Draconibacterium halophilum TaxID=2706887 RepID=UPI00193F52B6|nr:hypothetical protein [Draconibacterium halophilum]